MAGDNYLDYSFDILSGISTTIYWLAHNAIQKALAIASHLDYGSKNLVQHTQIRP